jgi:methylenetetrahydrofolate reductase (NADPH)
MVLDAYWGAGIRHLVALRGDPPGGVGAAFEPHPLGFANAAELVENARKRHAFEVSVAVHPEKHPNSPNWEAELANFKRKLDAGATRGISQFFFDADVFLRFRDRLANAGITAPILPGIMPVTNYKGVVKMAQGCGASIPRWLTTIFDGLDDDPETRRLVAAATTAELCARLYAEGVEDFHFYTLNRADLTMAICRIFGVQVSKEATP